MPKIRGYVDTKLILAVTKRFPIDTMNLQTTGLIEWAFKKLLELSGAAREIEK